MVRAARHVRWAESHVLAGERSGCSANTMLRATQRHAEQRGDHLPRLRSRLLTVLRTSLDSRQLKAAAGRFRLSNRTRQQTGRRQIRQRFNTAPKNISFCKERCVRGIQDSLVPPQNVTTSRLRLRAGGNDFPGFSFGMEKQNPGNSIKIIDKRTPLTRIKINDNSCRPGFNTALPTNANNLGRPIRIRDCRDQQPNHPVFQGTCNYSSPYPKITSPPARETTGTYNQFPGTFNCVTTASTSLSPFCSESNGIADGLAASTIFKTDAVLQTSPQHTLSYSSWDSQNLTTSHFGAVRDAEMRTNVSANVNARQPAAFFDVRDTLQNNMQYPYGHRPLFPQMQPPPTVATDVLIPIIHNSKRESMFNSYKVGAGKKVPIMPLSPIREQLEDNKQSVWPGPQVHLRSPCKRLMLREVLIEQETAPLIVNAEEMAPLISQSETPVAGKKSTPSVTKMDISDDETESNRSPVFRNISFDGHKVTLPDATEPDANEKQKQIQSGNLDGLDQPTREAEQIATEVVDSSVAHATGKPREYEQSHKESENALNVTPNANTASATSKPSKSDNLQEHRQSLTKDQQPASEPNIPGDASDPNLTNIHTENNTDGLQDQEHNSELSARASIKPSTSSSLDDSSKSSKGSSRETNKQISSNEINTAVSDKGALSTKTDSNQSKEEIELLVTELSEQAVADRTDGKIAPNSSAKSHSDESEKK